MIYQLHMKYITRYVAVILGQEKGVPLVFLSDTDDLPITEKNGREKNTFQKSISASYARYVHTKSV